MSFTVVVLVYASALGLALLMLYLFKAQAWYWHLLSLAAAFGVGLMPPPAGWQGPVVDLLFGTVFIFLLVWGVGGLLVSGSRSPRRKHA